MLTTLLWLGIAFLVGLQSRKQTRGRAHSCGAAATASLLAASQGRGELYHHCQHDGEGHYVSAANV